jgi:hypothetical protein
MLIKTFLFIFRFAVFSEEPIVLFEAFDYMRWPNDRKSLACHGSREIKALVSHFAPLLDTDETEAIPAQFQMLKARFPAASRQRAPGEAYSDLLATRPQALTAVLKLVEIMMVMSPSTATCERSFSKMNRCKTTNRASLAQSTLQDLMCVMHEGPELEDFDVRSSVTHWLSAGAGTRHVNGHALSKNKQSVDN